MNTKNYHLDKGLQEAIHQTHNETQPIFKEINKSFLSEKDKLNKNIEYLELATKPVDKTHYITAEDMSNKMSNKSNHIDNTLVINTDKLNQEQIEKEQQTTSQQIKIG